MAGHSKWANIQHRKKAQDAKRGKLFTKFIREITVAARAGGADLESNPRLRLAIEKAKSGNMTNDTIDRAVKRGAGGLDGQDIVEIRYEGYGPSGVAVIVDCMTDNKNRSVADVRHAFSKCGGNLGTDGSVSYLFTKTGQIVLGPGMSEDDALELGLETGADDVLLQDDETIEVKCPPEAFDAVKKAFEDAGSKILHAEVTYLPSTTVAITEEIEEKVTRLIDMLEDLDDVQNVYTNLA